MTQMQLKYRVFETNIYNCNVTMPKIKQNKKEIKLIHVYFEC